MTSNRKRAVSIKTRLVCGLVEVLKDDILRTRSYASGNNIVELYKSLIETKQTVQTIVDTIAEIEYELYLASQED